MKSQFVLREIDKHLLHWDRQLRGALLHRTRFHPGSYDASAARRYVRHCIKQLRMWEKEASSDE